MAREGGQGGDNDKPRTVAQTHHAQGAPQTCQEPNRGNTRHKERQNIKKKVKIETYNYLLVWGDELQGLLDDSAAVHLQGQRQDVPADALCQRQLLLQAAKLGQDRPSLPGHSPPLASATALPPWGQQLLTERDGGSTPRERDGQMCSVSAWDTLEPPK